jgi:hypothetical protein
MRTSLFGLTLASALLVGGPAIAKNKAQEAQHSTSATTQSEHSRSATGYGKTSEKGDVTYGRIKEMTAGQKVVVDVDNNIDKSYDLTDKDTKVNMPRSLKVGDPVRITEVDQNGHKSVRIAKDTSKVKHGDKTAAQEQGVRTDESSDINQAGRSAKEAGKSAGKAAKDAGRDVKESTKDDH